MHAVVVMAAIYKIKGSSMSADAENVVLIVEDEPLILMLLADYLSGEGYRVLKAENGEQAFEILATKPHLDLMITDYRLPGGVSGVVFVSRDNTLSDQQPGWTAQENARLPRRCGVETWIIQLC